MKYVIYCFDRTHLATGIQEEYLFQLIISGYALLITKASHVLPIKIWHQILGHLGLDNVKKLQDNATRIRLDETNISIVCKP